MSADTIDARNAEKQSNDCIVYTLVIEDEEDIEIISSFIRGMAEEIFLSHKRKQITISTS